MTPQFLKDLEARRQRAAHALREGSNAAPLRPPKLINPQDLIRLSQIDSLKGAVHILKEWALIAAAILVCEQYFSWPLYLAVTVLIGTRQHALGVLMHDAVHYRLFHNKSINDFVASFFCAWPLLLTLEGYRRQHLTHHRNVGGELDPDWVRTNDTDDYTFPASRKIYYTRIAKYLLGLNTARELYIIQVLSKLGVDLPWQVQIKRGLFVLVAVGLAVHFGVLTSILMYWTIPMSTALVAIQYIRYVAEHSAVPKGKLANSRNIYPKWWEKILIAQNGVHLHVDHHMYPSVPFYNLERLHSKLLENREYRQNCVITSGYFSGLLSEIEKDSGTLS